MKKLILAVIISFSFLSFSHGSEDQISENVLSDRDMVLFLKIGKNLELLKQKNVTVSKLEGEYKLLKSSIDGLDSENPKDEKSLFLFRSGIDSLYERSHRLLLGHKNNEILYYFMIITCIVVIIFMLIQSIFRNNNGK